MLSALARDQGVADCLAKFAIDAESMRKMMGVYSHLPSEKFNEVLKNRIALESKGRQLPSNFDALVAANVAHDAPPGTVETPTGVLPTPTGGKVPNVAPAPPISKGSMPRVTSPSFQLPPPGPVVGAAPFDKTVAARPSSLLPGGSRAR